MNLPLLASRILSFVLMMGAFAWFVAYATDTVSQDIATQTATQSGSNSSFVSFSTGTTSTGAQYYTQYINQGNDSAVIGNYLHGYYYDTAFGLFQLDWDSDPSNNVRVIDSTDRCGSGYGYKLGGFAKGVDAGFVNFNYSPDIFVYYCASDSKLHGYAYQDDWGFQSFEGISLTIDAVSTNTATVTSTSDPFFVNNNTAILTAPSGFDTVQGDEAASDWGKSSLFYIVK